jgi:hypothetical protein
MLDLDGHFDLGLIKSEARLWVRLTALRFIIGSNIDPSPAPASAYGHFLQKRSGKNKDKKETSKYYL